MNQPCNMAFPRTAWSGTKALRTRRPQSRRRTASFSYQLTQTRGLWAVSFIDVQLSLIGVKVAFSDFLHRAKIIGHGLLRASPRLEIAAAPVRGPPTGRSANCAARGEKFRARGSRPSRPEITALRIGTSVLHLSFWSYKRHYFFHTSRDYLNE
jgi:hypothetical protein